MDHHIIGWFLELRPGRGIWNILVKPLIPLHIRVSLVSFGSGGATALQDKETGKCTGWTKKHNCKRCPEVFCSFFQLSHGKCCSGCCDRVRKRHWLRELHWPRIGAKSYSIPQQLPLLGPGSRAVGTGRKMPETLDSSGCLLRVNRLCSCRSFHLNLTSNWFCNVLQDGSWLTVKKKGPSLACNVWISAGIVISTWKDILVLSCLSLSQPQDPPKAQGERAQ